jgi:hypothetical protein
MVLRGEGRVATLARLQREALCLAEERHELRRADFLARCGISRRVAGLVKAGLLRQVRAWREARYVAAPPSGD